MKRKAVFCLTAAMMFAVSGCGSKDAAAPAAESTENAQENITVTGTYSIHVGGYLWGPGVDRAIIKMDAPLDSVSADDFVVSETKQVTDFSDSAFPVIETTAERIVSDAYLCDENGEKTDSASNYAALELYVSPKDGSPLLFSMSTQLNTWSDPYELQISMADGADVTSENGKVESFVIDTAYTEKETAAEVFHTDQSFTAADGVTYQYAAYEPENETDTLFVWLHGVGEGGTENTDVSVACLGSRVTTYTTEEFQNTLGGAAVLVPQCPTYWMDADGKGSNFKDGAILADGTSYYTESLHELILKYKEETRVSNVVIAGCSNGGYMTMLLAEAYGNEFNAYVPICEALPDTMISDDSIQKLKDLNMFFIYSEDDPVVDPTLHEIPTLERLKNAGAANIMVSTTEQVVDTSGEYKDEEGNPFKYSGHRSWMYFDNNESKDDETGVSAWDWIAEQVKQGEQ